LDRIDLIIGVLALSQTELLQGGDDAPNWGQLRERIQRCRQLQIDRAGRLNADLLLA
jgi:predicted ATPase with chaperone activity